MEYQASEIRIVDRNLIRFSQACTIILLVLGFVTDTWIPIAVAALCQILGATGSALSPYHLLYEQIAKPSGIVKPSPRPDNPQPHHFASFVGGAMDAIGVLLLIAGNPVGWVFVGIVFVLANLNLWVNFCAGCMMYYQFNRLGVPGFSQQPVRES